MDSDVPVVLYDANVLFPFHVGHLLVYAAARGLVEAKWTKEIQHEWLAKIAQDFPDLPGRVPQAPRRHEPGGAAGHGRRIQASDQSIDFPDPDDRHVLAAAIHSGASTIVTRDRKFTNDNLKPFGLASWDPDDMLVNCYDRLPEDCVAMGEAARQALTKTRPTWDAYLEVLDSQGLHGFVHCMLDARSHSDQR